MKYWIWILGGIVLLLSGCKESSKMEPQGAESVVESARVVIGGMVVSREQDYDLTDQEVNSLIRQAERGQLKAAQAVCRYYYYQRNDLQFDRWRIKTKKMAQSALPDDMEAQQILHELSLLKAIDSNNK